MADLSDLRVGVLAVQGDVVDHVRALDGVGVSPVAVRRPQELADVDALVLPGGESTAMMRLLTSFDLLDPLRSRIRGGMPAYGSCAGLILLADELLDGAPGQTSVGGLDIVARRNAFGRQVASFEADIMMRGVTDHVDGPEASGSRGPVRAAFIRAPWVESHGPNVEVLATVALPGGGDATVAVRQEGIMATSFHPEVTDEHRVHAAFVRLAAERLCG